MSTNWDDNIYTCPICKTEDCVPPTGKKTSPILIVGEFPGEDEVKKGKPYSGATGGVFRTELAKVGIDLNGVRVCNLWQHLPNKNQECLNQGLQTVIREAKGRQAILLVGSDVVKALCDQKVSEVCGLQVTSPYLSAPIIMACVQPAIVFNNSIGELRLALKKFSEKAKDL